MSGSPPRDKVRSGKHVTLRRLTPARDLEPLYAASHGSDANRRLWSYMAYGPFEDPQAMLAWLEQCQASSDPLFLTVHAGDPRRPVGMASFLNIVPEMRRLEVGHIWYSPAVQRTKVNTEAIYLMLVEAFEQLGCRRVEWKCNADNARSREAARRLGFSYEGVFAKHMLVKGKNRDTAWYAMLDDDWPTVKKNLERWLGSDDPGLSLRELNRSLLRPPFE